MVISKGQPPKADGGLNQSPFWESVSLDWYDLQAQCRCFPESRTEGCGQLFPCQIKPFTHIHTLMCTHMPATIWLELASCPLWREQPVTRWHPSVRKPFLEGGSERKFKARWQETVTDSLFFSSGHPPDPSSCQNHYDYLEKSVLRGKSRTWSDGPKLYLINLKTRR